MKEHIVAEDSLNMERLNAVASALDNRDKVRIIDLVFSEGKKSITDVREQLNLNFSTVHKYLNQLEQAGLLVSEKTNDGGRLKKLYKARAFEISISPEFLSSLARTRPLNEKEKKILKTVVIGWAGKLEQFDTEALKNSLLSAGVPSKTIETIMKEVNQKLFEGMLVTELKKTLVERIQSEESALKKSLNVINSIEVLQKSRDLTDILEERGMKQIAKAQENYDINIRNVGLFRPISLQHNFWQICKHGLQIIGLESSPPKHLDSALGQLSTVISAVHKNLADTHQSFDCLNVYLAPYAHGFSKSDISQYAQQLVHQLYQLNSVYGIETMLNIELCVPKFLAKEPAMAGGEEKGIYSDYEAEARLIAEKLLDSVVKEKKQFPKVILKVRNRKDLPENIGELSGHVYFANLAPEWQTENANYNRDWSRLDSSWRGWQRTMGVPQLQYVTLNLPRLGLKSKNETMLFENLSELLEYSKSIFVVSLETILSKQISELKFLSHTFGTNKYCHIEDGICLVSALGLTGLIEQLTSSKELDAAFATKVLSFIKKNCSPKDASVRTGVTENKFYPIQQAFTTANNRAFGSSHRTYLGGVQIDSCPDKVLKEYNEKLHPSLEEKISYYSKLHPLLLGGCMASFDSLNAERINKILKSDIGLFCDKRSLIWP